MIGDIPAHWRASLLAECAQVQTGVAKGRKLGSIRTVQVPYLRVANVQDGYLDLSDVKQIELRETEVDRFRLRTEDVLLTEGGDLDKLGRGFIWHGEIESCVHQNHIFAVRTDRRQLLPSFLAYLVQSGYGKAYFLSVAHKTTNLATINTQKLNRFPIILPPLDEQYAIARALRTAQQATEARRREVALERERRAALTGHLFAFGTQDDGPSHETVVGEAPTRWQVAPLGDLSQFLQYGTSVRCDDDPTGTPVLRIPNVIGGRIDAADLKYAKLRSEEAEALRLDHGDLLFVRTNGRKEYTGRCAVYNDELDAALFASYLIRARPKTEVIVPEYLQAYCMTPAGRSYLGGRASNAADGKFNINTQTIRSVMVPVPPLDEQREIVGVLQACDAKIAALEREVALLDELFRALLEELMSGRLSALPLVEAQENNEVPGIASPTGSQPEFAGELSAEEHVEESRGA